MGQGKYTLVHHSEPQPGNIGEQIHAVITIGQFGNIIKIAQTLVAAHRIGMVAEVVHENDSVGREDDGVASTTTLEAATKMARRMATAAPLAVRTCVRSIRMAQDDGLDRSLWREADAQAQVWNSRDLHEGVDALVEKRRAEFCDFEHLQE